MRASGFALALLLDVAAGQFGTAHVSWDSKNNPSVSTPGEVPMREFAPPVDGRRTGLSQLPVTALHDILAGLNTECPSCETTGHYVSRIRSQCLALGPKALKQQLTKRGLRCDGCTMREHYLDRVLDTVHLAPR